MAEIIDGKMLATEIRAQVAAEVQELKQKGARIRFDAILVGDDPASKVYVRNKQRACEAVGVEFMLHTLPASCGLDELTFLIRRLSVDAQVTGILLQLPLPEHLAAKTTSILNSIEPLKDVDGLNIVNVGRMVNDMRHKLVPCTAQGVLHAIQSVCPNVTGKNVVVIGRSRIVGRPTSLLLTSQNATVTICHSYTKDLARYTRMADIVVVAAGKPNLVTGDMIKTGAIVIDVGINRLPDGKIVGDVDYDSVYPYVSAITPVPGGIGPLTIAFLLRNIVTAYHLQHKSKLL